MGKISILAAVEMMEEEVLIEKAIALQEKEEEISIRREIALQKNPYWGLKCNRGLWLTRFPLGSLPKDPEFTMAYVQAGGGFDAMGHWGITPEHLKELESQGWNYKEVALLAQFVPEWLCKFEGVNPKNYKTLERGLKRAEALKKMNIEYTCSVWTLGSMPIEKFLRRLFKKGIRVTKHNGNGLEINHLLVYRPYYEGHHTVYGNVNRALEAVSEGGCGRRLYNIYEIFSVQFLKYCRKCCKAKGQPVIESVPFIFSSLRAAKIFAKNFSIDNWCQRAIWGKLSFSGFKTSCGIIFNIHKQLLLVVKTEDGYRDGNNHWVEPKIISRSLKSVRQVAGFSVSKIYDAWFCWNNNDFSSHIEGIGSLQSVIERADKRRKKQSLILSLNDVRNDRSETAGFCLAGTKWFLENKMPFVFRLISQYENWCQIPEEIMSLEWQLASKDIFNGYSSPVY